MDPNAAALWGWQNPKARIIVQVFCPVKHPPIASQRSRQHPTAAC